MSGAAPSEAYYGIGEYGATDYGVVAGFGTGFGVPEFGNYPFGVGVAIPAGSRVGRTAASWAAIPRIYRADIAGNRLDDLTPPRVEAFTASYNDDTATKRAGAFEVMAPNEVNDLEDFLVVELDVVRDDGYELTIPLGHYVVMGRTTQMTNASLRGTLQGRDLTWLLQQATVPASYVVSEGTDPGEAARTILYQQGIPAQLVNIPDAGVTLGRDMPAMPGETWLGFLTDVLAAGAMYQPWVAMDGRITSKRVEDITAVNAVTEYHTADGAKIIPPIENQPDISRLRNRVTVRKVVPGQDPISYTADVQDRSSPVHPERLAERLGVNTPVVLGATYDEPNIADEDEAQLIAESRLSEGASFYDRVRIETYPDMALDAHLVMDLDIEHQGGTYYEGRWWQRTWDVRLQGPRPVVTRELTRTVRWR